MAITSADSTVTSVLLSPSFSFASFPHSTSPSPFKSNGIAIALWVPSHIRIFHWLCCRGLPSIWLAPSSPLDQYKLAHQSALLTGDNLEASLYHLVKHFSIYIYTCVCLRESEHFEIHVHLNVQWNIVSYIIIVSLSQIWKLILNNISTFNRFESLFDISAIRISALYLYWKYWLIRAGWIKGFQ